MFRQEHEERCIEFFGKPFTEVHQFLDQHVFALGLDGHRRVLHNPEGVGLVVEKFGEDARCPALLHLYDDFEYFQYYTAEGKERKDPYDYLREMI